MRCAVAGLLTLDVEAAPAFFAPFRACFLWRRQNKMTAITQQSATIPPIVPPAIAPAFVPFASGLDVGRLVVGLVGKALVAVRSLPMKLVPRYTDRSFASPSQPPAGAIAVACPSVLQSSEQLR